VRATGATGSIEHVRSSDRDALAPEVHAGAISRAELRTELARGVGRFLQNVKVEAVLSHGHFVGWRVVTLFPKRPEVHVQILKPGDVVRRVNGASIERPEVFASVFEELQNAKELVLEIERDGQPSTLHYDIND
jgi:general secretion pathway protein C